MENFRKKYHWSFILALIIFVLIGSLITRGYIFPGGNHYTHVPQIKAMLNPDLYQNDYYVQEMLKFTPRYYYQYLIYLLSQISNIPTAYFVYYILAFSSFITALFFLAKSSKNTLLVGGILSFFGLTSYTLIGYLEIFPTKPVPATFAMSIAVWGIYFTLQKKWIIAYLFFGIASLLQFLVGILPGLMVLPIMLIERWQNREQPRFWQKGLIALILFFGIGSFVYIPMIFGDTGDGLKFTNNEFVFIYGWVRNPHHIIPSFWQWQNWLDLIFFMLASVITFHNISNSINHQYSSKTAKNNIKLAGLIIVITSIIALIIGTIFVEFYPLSFVAKLQLARTVPFSQLIIFLAVAIQVDQLYQRGYLCLGLMLIILLNLPGAGISFFVIAIAIYAVTNFPQVQQFFKRLNPQFLKYFIWLVNVILLIVALVIQRPDGLSQFERVINGPILFLILLYPFIITNIKSSQQIKYAITYFLAISSSLFLILGLANKLPSPLLKVFKQQVNTYHIPSDDVTKLALQFKEISDQDSLILIPPFVSQFQFFAERSAIINFKHFPQTTAGIREWRKRMEAVFGVPLNAQLATGAMEILFAQQTGNNLVKVARQYQADYILTRTDWHPNIQGKMVAQSGLWAIYYISDDN
ncbi:MAG: DUF6798 domain-containing protein [Microcoleaceae cyanobacterium]